MKYISSALFIIGFLIVCIGICLGDVNFILAIKMLLYGMIAMWIGWILTEFYEWREERRYEIWEDDMRYLP